MHDFFLFWLQLKTPNRIHGGVELYILSLTTGVPHPDARLPVIHIAESTPSGQSMQVAGDVVLLSAIEESNGDTRQIIIYIVDWKLGIVTHVGDFLHQNFLLCSDYTIENELFKQTRAV